MHTHTHMHMHNEVILTKCFQGSRVMSHAFKTFCHGITAVRDRGPLLWTLKVTNKYFLMSWDAALRSFFSVVCFWWDLGLHSGLYTCKAGTLLLEPHFQPISFWLFWRWGFMHCLPRLASPQSFWSQLPSSWHPCYYVCFLHKT
jgi:hypothetical protein